MRLLTTTEIRIQSPPRESRAQGFSVGTRGPPCIRQVIPRVRRDVTERESSAGDPGSKAHLGCTVIILWAAASFEPRLKVSVKSEHFANPRGSCGGCLGVGRAGWLGL